MKKLFARDARIAGIVLNYVRPVGRECTVQPLGGFQLASKVAGSKVAGIAHALHCPQKQFHRLRGKLLEFIQTLNFRAHIRRSMPLVRHQAK